MPEAKWQNDNKEDSGDDDGDNKDGDDNNLKRMKIKQEPFHLEELLMHSLPWHDYENLHDDKDSGNDDNNNALPPSPCLMLSAGAWLGDPGCWWRWPGVA